MGNSAWVCCECRLAVRRPTSHQDEVPCPECGAACHGLGYKILVPQKRDLRAWRELRASLVADASSKAQARAAVRVRARHDLEQEIRRLKAMPASAGRERAIQVLRRRLDDT